MLFAGMALDPLALSGAGEPAAVTSLLGPARLAQLEAFRRTTSIVTDPVPDSSGERLGFRPDASQHPPPLANSVAPARAGMVRQARPAQPVRRVGSLVVTAPAGTASSQDLGYIALADPQNATVVAQAIIDLTNHVRAENNAGPSDRQVPR